MADDIPPDPFGPDGIALPWMGPSPFVIGVPLPTAGVLWRDDRAALALMGLAAYPDGVVLSLRLVERGRLRALARRGPQPPWPDRRIGVEYADGRRSVDPDPDLPWDHVNPPPAPVLSLIAGTESENGDVRIADESLWLWPLPPPGPVTIVVTWGHSGRPPTRHELDGAQIAAAAAIAEHIWPAG